MKSNEQLASELFQAINADDKVCAAALGLEMLARFLDNVGRLADAAQRIADAQTAVAVSGEPDRNFIGIPG